ncbi:putative movement protein [Chrysanthemum mosaic-associated virus]|uniref:Movement protein n=1 Tax=Chrysanthemum mosaic-associated virus TaxID=2746510 RepID=A0AAU9BTD9_9VIRU|nr:putative movement protein [Chrysanthemum mosaic-associated virus]BCK60945.1 putative movement protein [Chrysanthemum mosaic-associated virus]
MFTFILLSLASLVITNQAAEHDTSIWNDDRHLGDTVDTLTIDEMSHVKLKQDFEVTGRNQKLKVDFMSLFSLAKVKILQPNKLARITAMVLCWIPQANNIGGKVTLSLVDERKKKDDARRIETQVTFKPDRPVIGIFYNNFAMRVDDLKYMNLEFITHGVNMDRGTMGRLSFGYKVVMSKPAFYEKKNAEVFYLPIEKLPELSVEKPEDIYNGFVKKMAEKKKKEIDYFANMKMFIDMSKTPVNEATTSQEAILADLHRNLEILEKYKEDAEQYRIKATEIAALQESINDTKMRIDVYKNGGYNPLA